VKPAKFRYLAVESVDEAVEALGEYGDDASILAGGQSLVPLMNMRMAKPGVVIDINRVAELDGIEANGGLMIGALTRQAHAERSAEVAAAAPMVVAALRHVGHPAIRSRGTVGGNIAHADAASELPAVLVALGGEVVARGANGERTIPADDFFVTHYTTSLDRELVTQVRIPPQGDDGRWAFLEVARRHGDFALVGVATALRIGSDGTCSDARIALTGVAGRPFRPQQAEQALAGARLDDAKLAEVAALVRDEVDPTGDVHATADYRKRVSGVLVQRALAQAAGKETR
jgi:carbon-monoxide dehydrogenase medium subunit